MKIIRTDGPDGNAHYILGVVSDMLRQIHGRRKSLPIIEKYNKEAKSGDYENLKEVSKKYVPGLIKFISPDEDEDEDEDDDWWDDDEEYEAET